MVEILTADYWEVTDLIEEICATTDSERRCDLAHLVIAELVRHSMAEEMPVYPVMRAYGTPPGARRVHGPGA